MRPLRVNEGRLTDTPDALLNDLDEAGSLRGMTRVLVTGMSGTGKSTALAELARRGHQVVTHSNP